MKAVERIEEYAEIEQEPPAIIESNRPPHDVCFIFSFKEIYLY